MDELLLMVESKSIIIQVKKKEARTLTKTVKAEIHPELNPSVDHSSNHLEYQ
jgi:hypothetical protein